ncbi:MAG: MBL fold metallo-hydrolase [Planctomycetota bacterium]|nr:MBL fold metallo-hydrolase [Planctomycetota bacterium]
MVKIEHLGHASFRLTGSHTVYFDPYKLKGKQEPADIVFVTHSHFDHLSPQDLSQICTSSTVVFATPDCEEELKSLPEDIEFRPVEPGKSYEYAGIKIRTVRAYNTNKKYHPRENDWVGYVIEMDGESFYHPGDTDIIPEMEGIEPDYAFLPVSGTYVMTAEEAAEAYKMIRPKKGVFPMHYGVVAGSKEDAEKFLKLVKDLNSK